MLMVHIGKVCWFREFFACAFHPFAFQGETQKNSKTTIIMISTLCWYITTCCNDNMPTMIVSLQ